MHILKKSFLAISLCMAMGTAYADTDTNSNQTIEYQQIDGTTQNEISFESYAFSEPVVFTEMTKSEEEETQGARFNFIFRLGASAIGGASSYGLTKVDRHTTAGYITASITSALLYALPYPYRGWRSSSPLFKYSMNAKVGFVGVIGANLTTRFSSLDY